MPGRRGSWSQEVEGHPLLLLPAPVSFFPDHPVSSSGPATTLVVLWKKRSASRFLSTHTHTHTTKTKNQKGVE